MATIFKTSSGITDTSSFNEMQTFVNNYWGSAVEEKVFPIAYWKMKQLFAASSSEEIALRVTDINNPSLVDAEWMVFEEGMEDLLQDPVRQGEYYFVIDESVFQDIRNGIPTLTKPLNTIIIWGRLGKAAATGNNYHAFIAATSGALITPGSGGDGVITGAKIPPPQP